MQLEIKAIVTGHYGEKCQDSNLLLFVEGETDEQMVEALAEVYGLDEDEDGNNIGPLNVDFTWDWLESQIGSYAWWYVDIRKFDIRLERRREVPV